MEQQQLVLQWKAVEAVLGIHKAQLPSYMKLAGTSTGLLLTFNVELLRDELTRFRL